MKLSKDAKILSSDGKEIGNLNRFVIDPQSKQISHIVFEHGLLSRKEYVIPMRGIDHVDEQGIHLSQVPADAVDKLVPFTEDEYIITDERGLLAQGFVSDDTINTYYYYPPAPAGAPGVLRPDEMYIYNPPAKPTVATHAAIPETGAPPVRKELDENIPDNTVALKEGARVFSSDDKHLGDVEKVFVDPADDKSTHLLVSKGLLFKQHKLIPINWVTTIGQDVVYLGVDSAFANQLPDYQE